MVILFLNTLFYVTIIILSISFTLGIIAFNYNHVVWKFKYKDIVSNEINLDK